MSTLIANPTPVGKPQLQAGWLAWMRRNLFRTWLDSLLTLIVGAVVLYLLVQFFTWAIAEARWAVITENLRSLMQGIYPLEQGWRITRSVVILTLLAGVSWGLWGRMFFTPVASLILGLLLLVIYPRLADVVPANAGALGRYFNAEVIPLLEVLQVPVLTLAAILGMGYAAGRVGRTFNKVLFRQMTVILWVVAIPTVFLLVNGVFSETSALPLVPTSKWGGLLLTFMLAFVAMTACFPLGILLALGRTSGGGTRKPSFLRYWWLSPLQWPYVIGAWWKSLGNYAMIKLFCIIYIEVFRGVPLVTVFFTANLIVPIALGGAEIDPVVRAMIALTLFEAAYIAEIVRGGLQALPPGQYEAAKALGLNPLQSTLLIVLPQALRIVIPALVGQFITMFKDTSLVAIVGLSEFIGITNGILANNKYNPYRREAYVFIAIVYFAISFAMSRAAQQLERSGSGRVTMLK